MSLPIVQSYWMSFPGIKIKDINSEYNFQCRHPDKRYPRYIHDNSADLSRLFFVQKFYYLLYISEETYLVSLIA